MAEFQVTTWREIPSMVAAREGDDVAKVQLSARFQEAIDEAAMRLGDTGSDDYLAGWQRTPWSPGDGSAADLAGAVAKRLEDEWGQERLTAYLDAIGPAADA